MKKTNKILSAILCVAVLSSAFAFSACNIKKTDHDDDNQTDHVPVTTVANAEEWMNALDILSLDSFSVHEIDYYETNIITDGTVDMINCKANFTCDWELAWNKRYFEYDDNFYWEYDSSNGVYKDEADAVGAKNYLKESLSTIETSRVMLTVAYLQTPLFTIVGGSELTTIFNSYSKFVYQDGYYVTESLTFADSDPSIKVKVEIAIKDGVISELKIKLGADGQEYYDRFEGKINNVNSTTVTTPAEARTAIDAEKAKG